jgi:hypothetical protein
MTGEPASCSREGEGSGYLILACHADAAIVPVDVFKIEHQVQRVRLPIEA